MLRDALPHAVAPCPAGETRHEFQVKIIDCVRRALADADEAAEAQAVAAREASEAARAQEAEAKLAAASAEEATGAAGADVKVKADALGLAKTEVREEEALHGATELDTQQVLQEHKEHDARKSEIEALLGLFDGAAAWGVDGAENITTFLTTMRAEKPLVAALPAALVLAPDARSQFDTLVVDSAKAVLQGSLTEAQAAVDAGAEAAKNAEAERLGAWAVLDCARERAASADAALSAAKAMLADAQSAQAAKGAEVVAAADRLQVALVQQALAEGKPSDIANAQQALERLVQGGTAQEATPPVAAQAPATPAVEKTSRDVSIAPVPMDLDAAASAGA